MALGSTINGADYYHKGDESARDRSIPDSFRSKWFTVIDAAGMDDHDAAAGDGNPIIDPTNEITASTRHIINVSSGSLALVRFVYDDGDSAQTAPKIMLFGRTLSDLNDSSTADDWMVLENVLGDTIVTLTPSDSTDLDDNTYQYTHAIYKDHLFDLMGCNQVLVGVHTKYAATGDATAAYLEMKLI